MHDEELEHLEQCTRDVLGDEVCHHALCRAMAIARRRGRPADPDALAGAFVPADALALTAALVAAEADRADPSSALLTRQATEIPDWPTTGTRDQWRATHTWK
jgi:hypothetical protein